MIVNILSPISKTGPLGLSDSIVVQVLEAIKGDEKAVGNVGEARTGRVTSAPNSK